MVAATLRHLKSLRLMVCSHSRQDSGKDLCHSYEEIQLASRFRLDSHPLRGSGERTDASDVRGLISFFLLFGRNNTESSQDFPDFAKSRHRSPCPCSRRARRFLQHLLYAPATPLITQVLTRSLSLISPVVYYLPENLPPIRRLP